MKYIAIVVALFVLTGCDNSEQKAKINAQLPNDCKFQDMGLYNGDHIYAIFCNRHSVTTSHHQKSGKRYHEVSVVTE